MQPKAVITVGIPGCGKSTYAADLTRNDPSKVPYSPGQRGWLDVNLDDCREIVSGDASNQACTPDAVKMHTGMIDGAIRNAVNVVVSDTNLNAHFRGLLINKLQAAGYHVTMVIFKIPFDVCQARNTSRDRVVPLDAMQRMQAAFDNGIHAALTDDVVYIDMKDQAG